MAFLNSGSPFIDGKQRNRRTCPGSHSLDLRTQRLFGKTPITEMAKISPDAFGLKGLQCHGAERSSGAELLAMAAASETRLCFLRVLGERTEGELTSADSKPNRGCY